MVNTFTGALALAALLARLASHLGRWGATHRLGPVGHERVHFSPTGAQAIFDWPGGVHAAHGTVSDFHPFL